jgi:CHAD domain-containing protein
MRYQFAEMLRHEAGTRQGVDIEALHDMRVATRRMRAAFEVFSEAFEPSALKLHLKGLRATGRALGQVRDLDVFMEEAQRFMATLSEGQSGGLDPLLLEWKGLRDKTRDDMLAYLDSQNYLDFKKKFNLFVNTPGAGTKPIPPDLPTPQRVIEIAPVYIYERLANVRAFEPIIENASIQELHALRIEFKKLRYTVEYFREVMGEEAKPVINTLKSMQDHLGELNDAQVASQLIQDFLTRWQAEQKQKGNFEDQQVELVQAYLAYRQNQRDQLIKSFPEAWSQFTASEFRRNLALAVSVL